MKKPKVRYAVIGLGHIAQVAVLPAFRNARKSSELTALVSDDAEKLRVLSERYEVPLTYRYEEIEDCFTEVDAVYIALPNNMHHEYAVRAARAGVHVLCEKPMAVTSEECRSMIQAAEDADVRLMVAYRLHFEKANLSTLELVRSGKLGEPRIFTSTFTMQVAQENIRLQKELGGGPLYDIGIYCINAARTLFGDEPTEVMARSARGRDARFTEVDEMTSAVLRFPGDRLAGFTCSFGAADTGGYRLVGTEGDVQLDPAYEYAEALDRVVTIGDRTREKRFAKRDQFGPELVYFSECVREHLDPEPSGTEGLADVRVIEALLESVRSGQAVQLEPFAHARRPEPHQEIHRPAVDEPKLVNVDSPHP